MRRIFLPLLIACCACAGAGPASDSGITGQVSLGPTCSVQRTTSPCPDRPLSATLSFVRDGRVVATARSGEDGSFDVNLAPGTYRIEARALSAGQSLKQTHVTVRPHAYTPVAVHVDSGIR